MDFISNIFKYNPKINYAKMVMIIGLILIITGVVAIFSVSIYESFTVTLKIGQSGNSGLINNVSVLVTILILVGLNYMTKNLLFNYYKINFLNIFTNVILSVLIFRGAKSIISANMLYPTNYFYFRKQIVNIFYGVIAASIVHLIPAKVFEKQSNTIIFFGGAVLLQLLVFVPGIGAQYHGAMGWVDIPGLPSIQPVEFFKLGYIFFLSSWLIRKQKYLNSIQFLISFIILHALLFTVFLVIRDMGSVLVMGLTGLILSRYVGIRTKYVVSVIFLGLSFVAIFLSTVGLVTDKFDYIKNRVAYFMQAKDDIANRTIGYQNYQALIAVGGGGFRGQGYGKGQQKMGYIPEAQSDFIFSAFAEEMGFIFGVILLLLYLLFAYFAIMGLHPISNKYIKLIGMGIITMISVQVFVNLSVNIQILPNTGLTLPFISYGGTAMMINMIEIVILHKIIRKYNNAVN